MDRIKKFLFVNTNTNQTVVKNIFWLFLGEIVGRLFKFFLVIYAARILGVDGWGLFSYILAFASLFLSFADVGLNTLAVKELSLESDSKFAYLSTSFYIKVILLGLACLATILFAPLSNVHASGWFMFAILLFLFSDSLRDFLMSVNRSMEKMEREAALKITSSALVGALGIALLFVYRTPTALAFGYGIGSFLGMIISYLSLSGYKSKILNSFSKEIVMSILKSVWPITISLAVNTATFSTDTLALGYFKDTSQVGLYAAAQRIILFLYVIPLFLTTSLMPTLARLAKDNVAEFKTLLYKSAKIFSVIALAITGLGMLLAKPIILLSFGGEYSISVGVFRILLLLIVATFLNFLIIYGSIAINKQKELLVPNLVVLVLNLLLNIALVPKYGVNGAAIASVISLNILVILSWHRILKVI